MTQIIPLFVRVICSHSSLFNIPQKGGQVDEINLFQLVSKKIISKFELHRIFVHRSE